MRSNSAEISDKQDTAVISGGETQSSPAESEENKAVSDEEQLYDTRPISQAYLTGDVSALDEFQLEIYQKAVEVIEGNISPEMTDYEKELAIHDYLVLNAAYEEQMLGVFETHGENAVNPYGALIEGKAICSGYTTSFQMFMDMLEIPCLSVKAADADGDDHAWNMVQLDGEWYYVDVTWDDPIPDREGIVRNKYFNVTGEYMALKHVWRTDDLPEADSYENSYIANNLYKIDDFQQIGEYMTSYIERGRENIYFEFDESLGVTLYEADGVDDYKSVNAADEGLADFLADYVRKNPGISVSFQCLKFEDRFVLGLYMKK